VVVGGRVRGPVLLRNRAHVSRLLDVVLVGILTRVSTPAAEPNPVVTGDPAFQNEVLEELAGAVNYRGWLVSLVEQQLGQDPLEVGSGTGEYAASLSAQGQNVTVSEAYGPSLRRLQERFAGDERVTVRELAVPADVEGGYSSVFAFNVLEHIPDDAAALASMGRLVRPGGRVMVFVPAFTLLMSRFDRQVGHQRRYRAAELRRLAEGAGLSVERLHHVNAPGFLAWLVGMRLLKGRPKDGPALRVWDRLVVPPTRRLESWHRPPFGQSLFLVARRA